MPDTYACSECGADVEGDAVRCPSCGAAFEEDVDDAKSVHRTLISHGWRPGGDVEIVGTLMYVRGHWCLTFVVEVDRELDRFRLTTEYCGQLYKEECETFRISDYYLMFTDFSYVKLDKALTKINAAVVRWEKKNLIPVTTTEEALG